MFYILWCKLCLIFWKKKKPSNTNNEIGRILSNTSTNIRTISNLYILGNFLAFLVDYSSRNCIFVQHKSFFLVSFENFEDFILISTLLSITSLRIDHFFILIKTQVLELSDGKHYFAASCYKLEVFWIVHRMS